MSGTEWPSRIFHFAEVRTSYIAIGPSCVPTASLWLSWWNATIGKSFTIIDNIIEMILWLFFLKAKSFGSKHLSSICVS